MNDYEFWDELGKIFNAVVAYQEKSIEFNKRFINPWIRLGNVFDKQDRNKDAIEAYKKAIELDPLNAQNWYELGNAQFRMESYQDAAETYQKAIELEPASGWAYGNLAFSLVKQGKYEEAIPLYQNSLNLLENDKDKAVAWNRLGNLYRKLNQYELAVDAFQKADELDGENAGFHDELDDVPDGPTLVEGNPDEAPGNDTEAMAIPTPSDSADELADGTSPAEDDQDSTPDTIDSVSEDILDTAPSTSNIAEEEVGEEQPDILTSAVETQQDESQEASGPDENTTVDSSTESEQAPAEAVDVSDVVEAENVVSDMAQADTNDETPQVTEVVEVPSDEAEVPATTDKQTITIIVQNIVETYTDTQIGTETVTQTTDEQITTIQTDDQATNEEVEAPVAASTDGGSLDLTPEPTTSPATDENEAVSDSEDETDVSTNNAASPEPAELPVDQEIEAASDPIDAPDQAAQDNVVSAHAAYEEFLKDNGEDIQPLAIESSETAPADQDEAASQDPVTRIDPSGEIQIEVDTKNARVWNELGNVYFNTNAYEDAIAAYTKAIELDRQFAWPYSNLALTYVQMGRFAEAILLYQRSIELFMSEKDRAISWNRLGNVYRRLNDYVNAIAAYQQADALDPDNTTLSLQSRFSLLGNYFSDSDASYVA